MSFLQKIALISLANLLLSASATAEFYKCARPDGTNYFSNIACRQADELVSIDGVSAELIAQRERARQAEGEKAFRLEDEERRVRENIEASRPSPIPKEKEDTSKPDCSHLSRRSPPTLIDYCYAISQRRY
jgi:hypothetical protein